jgi:hypothetical protein
MMIDGTLLTILPQVQWGKMIFYHHPVNEKTHYGRNLSVNGVLG